MRLIMIEILIMNFGGLLFNPHYLHTLLHDVIKKNFSYFGSAAFAPRHAAEVGVVFPARRLRHGVMSPGPVSPTHTRAPLPPPHSCAALAVDIAAATLTATRSPLACRRPALQGCSWRQEPPSRSSVRGRARPLEATRESVWYIHHEETEYTRALCVRGNSCSEIKSCHQDIARSPAPRAPRRSNHEARLDPRPSRLYRGPEDDRIPPRRACAKAGWRRYWVDLFRIRRFYANSTQQSTPQLTNGGRHMEMGTNRAGPR